MIQHSLTHEALMYIWRQFASRVGIPPRHSHGTGFETLPLFLHYGQPEYAPNDKLGLVVVPCAKDAWYNLITLPANTLNWLPQERVLPTGAKLPFTDKVPVLFWGAGYEDGHKPFAERRENGTVVFYADIVAAALFMLSRWEETVVSTRDQHDRFSAGTSVAYKQGFLDRPIVDEYALILQAWLKVLRPGFEPLVSKYRVKLSHDVDDARHFSFPYRLARALVVTLRDQGSIFQYGQRFISLLRAPDPLTGICKLADLSEQYGLKSAFYFQAAECDKKYDRGYDLTSSWIEECVNDLRKRGHEIGFHPGYYTFGDSTRFIMEKEQVERDLNQTVFGGRQHFLRFSVPQTWRIWEKAGMEYDSTLGFADHEGFRCGTCRPFSPFDLEQNRELDLIEVPLLIMDGTLYQYRNLTPEQGQEIILQLAQRCYQVNGVFTLLWHNTSLGGYWQPWFDMYKRVLPTLVAM